MQLDILSKPVAVEHLTILLIERYRFGKCDPLRQDLVPVLIDLR